ncbi:uncharacterized protein METZ01_LOCUS222106, partial [marine metagenome]
MLNGLKVADTTTLPKFLFKLFFALYMFTGMHVTIEHVGGYGLYLPFNIIGWMFVSVMIGLGLWQIGKKEKILFSQFHCLSWIGFGLMCLPLLYPNNEHADLAIMRLLGLGGGLLLYLSFQQFRFKKIDLYWFFYILLGGVLIQTFHGLSEHFLPIESWLRISIERSFGVLRQNNIMATFLVTGVVVSLFLLLNDKSVYGSLGKQVMIYSIPLLTSAFFLPLQSRTGYLTFIIALGLLLLFGLQKQKKKQVAIWLGLVLIGLLIGFKTP